MDISNSNHALELIFSRKEDQVFPTDGSSTALSFFDQYATLLDSMTIECLVGHSEYSLLLATQPN